MAEHAFVYSNMAVADEDVTRIKTFMVVRMRHERLDKPEPICWTRTRANTELISEALNASLGLSNDEASELVAAWLHDDQAGAWTEVI